MLPLLFTDLFAAAWRWRERRKTIQTLSGLDDRMLKDIGLARCQIESAVREIDRFRPASAGRSDRAGRAVVLPNGALMDVTWRGASRRA